MCHACAIYMALTINGDGLSPQPLILLQYVLNTTWDLSKFINTLGCLRTKSSQIQLLSSSFQAMDCLSSQHVIAFVGYIFSQLEHKGVGLAQGLLEAWGWILHCKPERCACITMKWKPLYTRSLWRETNRSVLITCRWIHFVLGATPGSQGPILSVRPHHVCTLVTSIIWHIGHKKSRITKVIVELLR